MFGHEHYAEHLEDLACAAAPVRHPVSSKILGVVDLTCWRKDASALLIALARSTPAQITQALLNDSSAGEVELLQEYLRACRHAAGIVFALDNNMVMMSRYAGEVLGPGDQAAVLGHAAQALAAGHLGLVDVELPSGARAQMSCLPFAGEGQRRHRRGITHVKLLEPAGMPGPGQGRRGRSCQAWSDPVRCGCAGAIRWTRPIPQASGWRWRASPEPASWRCFGLCTGAATRPALCMY